MKELINKMNIMRESCHQLEYEISKVLKEKEQMEEIAMEIIQEDSLVRDQFVEEQEK